MIEEGESVPKFTLNDSNGNKIKSTEVIDLSSAIVPLNLKKGNMYIIQVNYLSSKIKTFKIIAL